MEWMRNANRKFGMSLRAYRSKVKIFTRCYCGETNNFENVETTLRSHVYCNPPFTNYVELTSHLLNNIIYKNGGLLILNRPHGLKKNEAPERGFWLKRIKLNISPSLQCIDKLTFTGVLPYLMKEMQLKHLQLLKAPDRHMSGVSVLSYHKKLVRERVGKALSPSPLPKYTFLAVCGGIPFVDSKSVKLGLTLSERGSSKKVIFVQNYSKRAVASGKVFPFTVNHKVLSANEQLQVALVELESTKNKWNAIRAYCAMRLLSPALGDSLFGSYVQEISGTRIAVDPFSPAAAKPYKLPSQILQTLGLTLKQQSIVPLHIHLAKLNFQSYRSDGRIFTAKPPDQFLWTCEKFGLTVPAEYLDNRVSERYAKPTSSTSVQIEENDSILETCSDDDDDDGEGLAICVDNCLEFGDDKQTRRH